MFVKNITETTQKIRIDWVETEIGAWEVFQTTESKAEELVRNYPSIIGYADTGDVSWVGDAKRQVVSVYSDMNNPFNVEANTLYKSSASQFLPNNVIPLVVIAGQSNADWRASYTTLNNRGTTKRIADNNYNVDNYFMRNNTSKTFNTYNVRTNNWSWPDNWTESSWLDHYSFDPFFARYFTNTYNKPLYAVRMAVWWTPIWATRSRWIGTCTWNAKIWYFETLWETVDHYLCQDLLNKIKNIQKRAEENNKTILPVAILWHQWETDGWSADTISTYKQNLSNVISYIRGIFGTPTLPFINAFIQKDYKETYPQINSIYVTMNGEDKYMKTVDMAWHYTDIGDWLHYDWEALAYMGAKMFEYYKTFDLTFNDYNPWNWCDITSQFGNIVSGKRWTSWQFQNITSIEEFESLTAWESSWRSCVTWAIIWSDYKADFTKIRITPIGSNKHFFISNRGVDNTLYSVWWSDWQSGQVVYDLTNATNWLIMSLNIDAALTDWAPLSNYFKIEALSKY